MDHKELDKLFNNTIGLVKNKNVKPPFKVKKIHTNRNSKETSKERQKLGKAFSDMNRVNNTIIKIQNAIAELEDQGVKNITNAAICGITGLCRNTVSNRRKELEVYNINEIIGQVNESYADDKSRFYNDGYIAKEAVCDNKGEVICNEVMDTQNQDESMSVIDNTQEEYGADNEDKNRIYAERYNQIKERYMKFKEINRELDRDSIIGLEIMGDKYKPAKELLELIRA